MAMRAGGGFGGAVGRWGWVILCLLGALGLMAGGWFFVQAHPTVPVHVSGRIVDYERITSGATYLRNDLRLANDGHTYSVITTQFQPALPTQLFQNGRVVLWVDQGTPNVVAITLYDQNDANPVTSTTPAYDHPALAMQTNQQTAELISAVSIVLLLAALGWGMLLLRGQRRPRPAAAPSGGVRFAQPGSRR
jgi:hypothetical protein